MSYDVALWRWSDNPLPGDPEAIFDAISRSVGHPAIAHFSATAALSTLLGKLDGDVQESVLSFAEIGHFLDPPCDWIIFSLAMSECPRVLPALQNSLAAARLVLFDPQERVLLPPSLPKQHLLDGDGIEPLHDPNWVKIHQMLQKLNATGPSFFALTDRTGSYFR